MRITLVQAKRVANKLNINIDTVPLAVFRDAMMIELEHGKRYGGVTNVTNDNLLLTGKIALAHLLEYPDYYKRLDRMEKQAEKYWSDKKKPKVLN